MRILHLTTFLQGGAGRAIVDLALDQRQAGSDVSVVASNTGAPGYGNYDAYVRELEDRGIPVSLVDSMFSRDHASNLAVVGLLDRQFARGEEPDVIHSHAAIPSLVGLLFAGSRRRPTALVHTMHGWGLRKTPDQVETDIALLNLVDRVAVASRHSADTLVALGVGASRIEVVPYGIREGLPPLESRDRLALDAMDRARAQGAIVAACVGTIGPRKNQTLLVDALARVRSRAKVFAVFAGDGDVEGLRAAVDAAGVGQETWIHGYSPAARSLAAHADLLVLPSLSEGQPIAILEAFCDRLLVAVSDIPELAELVEDGFTGFRFTSGDAASLADVLAHVFTLAPSTHCDIQDRSRSLYLARFATSAMTTAYRHVYDSVRFAPSGANQSPVPSAA